jgi:YbgC/YbaW family acyl-CoA thioester hydrolase
VQGSKPSASPAKALRNHRVVNFSSFMSTAEGGHIPTIQTEHHVMFFDTDCAGIVHNLAYLRFIETARTLLAEELGLNLVEMARESLYPVLVRTEIDYKRSAGVMDKVVVKGRLESVERSRFWCAFEVRRMGDDLLLCTCRQMLALVRMPTAKVMRMPDDWMEKYVHLKPLSRQR